jgi:hypothetical protein
MTVHPERRSAKRSGVEWVRRWSKAWSHILRVCGAQAPTTRRTRRQAQGERSFVALSRSVLALALLVASPALAHKPSDAYMTLSPNFRFDVALRDLDDELGLDADGNGSITWAEVQAKAPAIEALIQRNVHLDGCTLPLHLSQAVTTHSDGTYLVLTAPLSGCTGIHYTLFFARDPQHRALIRLPDQTLVAGTEQRDLRFSAPAQGASFGRFLFEGIRHILIGADHLLFLTALLLPSVLRRRGKLKTLSLLDYERRPSLGPALAEVLKLVTSFTVAHSITLALSALDVVDLPSRLVESTIAATVVFAAVANLWPLSEGERWGPAFALGLVHGFGFSSVLKDLGLRGSSLVAELFGFNLGVEVGQLCFVAVVVPLAWGLSRFRPYPALARMGSLIIAVIGLGWFFQRAIA